jgi:hypothetical protein
MLVSIAVNMVGLVVFKMNEIRQVEKIKLAAIKKGNFINLITTKVTITNNNQIFLIKIDPNSIKIQGKTLDLKAPNFLHIKKII